MFPVPFSGKICPVSPVCKGGCVAGRVSYTPSLLYGFGIISGRFLTLLFVLFLLVKSMNKLHDMVKKPEEKKEPRKCPYCLSVIPDEATRCPHCTSELPGAEK